MFQNNKTGIIWCFAFKQTLWARFVLFLFYINDIVNSTEKLSFRLFADDTNIFASSKKSNDLETTVNQELTLVEQWWDINKLSINMKKTNFYDYKISSKKLISSLNINIPSNDGRTTSREKRTTLSTLV